MSVPLERKPAAGRAFQDFTTDAADDPATLVIVSRSDQVGLSPPAVPRRFLVTVFELVGKDREIVAELTVRASACDLKEGLYVLVPPDKLP